MADETIEKAADSSIERIREWSTISNQDMDSSIEHSRWMTTLCMAEIAAIAGYNELEGGELNLAWAFVVLALALSIGIFVRSIIKTRETRMRNQQMIATYPLSLDKFLGDEELSRKEIRHRLMTHETSIISDVNESQGVQNNIELAGHWIFLWASVIAGMLVLLLEFGDMLLEFGDMLF